MQRKKALHVFISFIPKAHYLTYVGFLLIRSHRMSGTSLSVMLLTDKSNWDAWWSSMEQDFIPRHFHQLNYWAGSREWRMSSLTLDLLPHMNKFSIQHEQHWCLNSTLSHHTALYVRASGIHHFTALAGRLYCNWIQKGVLSKLQGQLLASTVRGY